MSTSQSIRQRNVLNSFYRHVKANLDAGSYQNRIFRNALDVPESLAYWYEIAMISGGAGHKRPTIVQVDCYYRVGDRGNQTTSDAAADKVIGMADDFVACLPSGVRGIRVYDFSANPASPTITDQWLVVRSSDGSFNWHEEMRAIEAETGLQRIALTLHVWLQEDLRGVQAYR